MDRQAADVQVYERSPAAYLRQLPPPLAGINLQYGLTNHRAEPIKTVEVANGLTGLRAVTGPDNGRIHDHELVSAVQRIAGNGTGDTRWKVPEVCAEPELIIADEPMTDLDVAVQAQIMDLLARICDEHGTSMMLVTHDTGVIADIAHRVAVM